MSIAEALAWVLAYAKWPSDFLALTPQTMIAHSVIDTEIKKIEQAQQK